jgi:hypothetical protein
MQARLKPRDCREHVIVRATPGPLTNLVLVPIYAAEMSPEHIRGAILANWQLVSSFPWQQPLTGLPGGW